MEQTVNSLMEKKSSVLLQFQEKINNTLPKTITTIIFMEMAQVPNPITKINLITQVII
jgi:hypothetical protein